MEVVNNFLETVLTNFDFGFCISVNILTYLFVKLIEDLVPSKVLSKLVKRIILIISAVILSIVYTKVTDVSNNIIINSAILAPVFWSWVAKPVCKKLGVDYNQEVIIKDDNN